MLFNPYSLDDYTVGWICALPIELAAATEMLDEIHDYVPYTPNDTNSYTFGRIGGHNVVIACLPAGRIGTNSAAEVANHMCRTFKSLKVGLLVGIGGGVPCSENDIRLGDVVVSVPKGLHGGVVQYDLGKTETMGQSRFGQLDSPPSSVLKALSILQSNHLRGQVGLTKHLGVVSHLPKFANPGSSQDHLYKTDYHHIGGPTCRKCKKSKQIRRTPRDSPDPLIHYGTVASGNRVIKNGETRDRISQDLNGVLCFEMEAAGLMNAFPCLVIRGICDYADSHKNQLWQGYAAATSAAYAKELLYIMPPSLAIKSPRQLSSVIARDVILSPPYAYRPLGNKLSCFPARLRPFHFGYVRQICKLIKLAIGK